MRLHPGLTWRFAPGAHSAGHDIAADDGSVVAEVFAAVDPNNNKKLGKDIARVRTSQAAHRYVIYRSPKKEAHEIDVMGVKVIALGPTRRG